MSISADSSAGTGFFYFTSLKEVQKNECTQQMYQFYQPHLPVFASASGDPISVITNLNNFIFSLIHAVGLILTGFCIVQIGLSLKSHDPSQRANGIMTVASGVVIMCAKAILTTIAG